MRRSILILAQVVLAGVCVRAALADAVTVQVGLAPSDFESRARLKGLPEWVLSIPPDTIDTTTPGLEVEDKANDGPATEFEYPRIVLRANAFQSGTYRVTLYGYRGEFKNENWSKLVYNPNIIKFEFSNPDELFQWLGLSSFELRRRTAYLNSGADLDSKTGLLLYHYLRLWIAISQYDDLVMAPSEKPYSRLVQMLSEYLANGDRAEKTGIPRSEIDFAIRQARAIRANYYQRLYQNILKQESCDTQAALLRRMSASFDTLSRDEQVRVAANFNSLPNSPPKSASQWRQQIAGDIRDREDRAAKNVKCLPP